MYQGKRLLAVVPARSGSKGLPNKNILPLNGKPMLAYSILAAINAGVFEEIFVSTDSEEYAEISKHYGASVPFLRAKELATDTSSSWDCVIEALVKYKALGKEFDYVVFLQPTSPLRTAQDILDALQMMVDKNADAVVAVCETEHCPLWSNTLPENLSMTDFIPPLVLNIPRQSIPKYYRINGAVYIVKAENIQKSQNIYTGAVFAYIMPRERSIDIDVKCDFLTAEMILNETEQAISK